MIERGVSHVIIDASTFASNETIYFTVMQEQMVQTEFWHQYKQIQLITGALSYALQLSD